MSTTTREEPRPLWSVPDVSRRLSMSRASVYRMIERGELVAYTLPSGTIRIPPEAVDRLLKEVER